MTASRRFAIGGIGGLLPIVVAFLSYDIGSIIDNLHLLNAGELVGYAIKIIILFVIGGVFASFNDKTTKPLALLQVGIAAPAIITTYINGASIIGPKPTSTATLSMPLISEARAAGISHNDVILKIDFLGDVVTGITKPLPAIQRQEQEKRSQTPSPAPSRSESTSPPPQPTPAPEQPRPPR